MALKLERVVHFIYLLFEKLVKISNVYLMNYNNVSVLFHVKYFDIKFIVP